MCGWCASVFNCPRMCVMLPVGIILCPMVCVVSFLWIHHMLTLWIIYSISRLTTVSARLCINPTPLLFPEYLSWLHVLRMIWYGFGVAYTSYSVRVICMASNGLSAGFLWLLRFAYNSQKRVIWCPIGVSMISVAFLRCLRVCVQCHVAVLWCDMCALRRLMVVLGFTMACLWWFLLCLNE